MSKVHFCYHCSIYSFSRLHSLFFYWLFGFLLLVFYLLPYQGKRNHFVQRFCDYLKTIFLSFLCKFLLFLVSGQIGNFLRTVCVSFTVAFPVPFRNDLNQIPNDYTVEVRNRFKGLDLIECLMNYGRRFVTLYRRQGTRSSPRKRNAKKQNGCLRKPYK